MINYYRVYSFFQIFNPFHKLQKTKKSMFDVPQEPCINFNLVNEKEKQRSDFIQHCWILEF